MRDHTAISGARQLCLRTILATAFLLVGTACSDRPDATSADSANFLSLDTRDSRNSLLISLRDSSLTVGDTVRIVLPDVGQSKTDGRMRIEGKFRSSDTSVVSVDSYGLARAVREGTATLTARTTRGTGSVSLTVVSSDATSTSAADSTTAATSKPVSLVPDDPAVAPIAPVPPAVGAPVSPPMAQPPTALPSIPGIMPSYVTPQLPMVPVDVSAPSPSRTIRVAAGDATGLQAALNAAVGGDEIVLPDGAIFVGSFHLPDRSSGGTVVIRSATVPVAARTRITPSQAGSLATLRTNSVFPAVVAEDGAHGWRITGVRMQLADNVIDNYGIVTIGSGTQTSMAQFPRNIVLDRVVINGSTTGNTSRCVSMNGLSIAVIDSWLSECHAAGRDAQAIAAWTGSGPLLVENNHLEGSGQAILLGGSDPLISGMVPADVTIRRNHLFKPLAWAGRWTVKAAFEIKNAERVLFEANVIENHWADAQVGFAILMQAVSQDARASWSTVRDVTLRLNVIRNSRSGVNLLSRLSTAAAPVSQPSRRILLRDNSFESVGHDPVSGAPGRFVQLLDDLEDVTLVQNTFFGTGASNAIMFDGRPLVRLALANNVFASATYGILGSGAGEGLATLARFAPNSAVTGNVLTGLLSQLYSPGNVFPATLSASDFVDPANGNFSVRSGIAFGILNGARTGVDGTAVAAATSGVTVR